MSVDPSSLFVWHSGLFTLSVFVLFYFFNIRFWYLRCCGCPWNRSRQHLATPLKTCHNTEAGFLTGWLLCLSPNSEVTASETPPFQHLGCVPAVVPAKGDHPPSHDDNFARTLVCRWLPQKPTASQKIHKNITATVSFDLFNWTTLQLLQVRLV